VVPRVEFHLHLPRDGHQFIIPRAAMAHVSHRSADSRSRA
jgi:hypothetical protein